MAAIGDDFEGAEKLIKDVLLPAFNEEKERLDRIDRWLRFDHEPPHQPPQATKEYKELRDRAQAPWLSLVVTTVAQNMYVDGHRSTGNEENTPEWQWWQANGMDARQIALHRAALGYGMAYTVVLPGEDLLTGAQMPIINGYSPRRMMGFYLDPAHDEWPAYALRVEPVGKDSLRIFLYDEEVILEFTSTAMGDNLQLVDLEIHDVGVCPVVRFANAMDLEGRTPGEVEPFIPMAGRIDQTTFDRLVVQRFASWIVRTISGMSAPEAQEGETPEMAASREKLRLKVEDLLIAEDPETKFGSLPATQLDGFIKAAEADILALAAASQTPAHEMIGQMANLSAEALAAARASLMSKVEERQTLFGESHEQMLRLASWVAGDERGASDFQAQVKWRDTEIRSLAQAADALGKMAEMLQVPVQMLWERLPGFTQQDVERAKELWVPPPVEPVGGTASDTPAE
jgi:hypothetical protein